MAGTEAEHLIGALDRQRWTFRWKADGLDAEALGFRLPSSSLSLGAVMKHLAACEALKMTWDIDASRPWEPFAREDAHLWAFESAATDSPEELYALYDGVVARARERTAELLASGGLDQTVALGQLSAASMRWR